MRHFLDLPVEVRLGLYIGAKTGEETGEESRVRTETVLQVAADPVGIIRRDGWGCPARDAKRAPSLGEERDHGVHLRVVRSEGSLRWTGPGTSRGAFAGVGCVTPLEKHHRFGASVSIINFSWKMRYELL